MAWRCLLSGVCLLLAMATQAAEVSVRALFSNSALLEIDGERKLLKAGSSYQGVTLVSADSKAAVIELEGERHRLGVSRQIAASFREAQTQEVRLSPDAGGHYVTPARINNRPVEVMVDTGATAVAMSLPQAKALGIDYRNGQLVPISTANGYMNGYRVTLNKVSVGAVTIENVEALVSVGDFPETILLGNSYLSRVNMFRENGVLVFQSRY